MMLPCRNLHWTLMLEQNIVIEVDFVLLLQLIFHKTHYKIFIAHCSNIILRFLTMCQLPCAWPTSLVDFALTCQQYDRKWHKEKIYCNVLMFTTVNGAIFHENHHTWNNSLHKYQPSKSKHHPGFHQYFVNCFCHHQVFFW